LSRSSPWLALAGAATVCTAAAAPASAQSVPEVHDVYSQNRPSSKLGPAVTPQQVLDAGRTALARARLVRYEARAAGAGEVSGTVLHGRSGSGSFDQFRATIRGRTAEGEAVLRTVGSNGGAFFVVDLLAKTVAEAAGWEELGAAGPLARALLWPDLERVTAGADSGSLFEFPSPETVGDELCYVVHFPDEAAGAHVYVALSLDDGLPRRVERVVAGPDGGPSTVVLEISDVTIDPPPVADAFEPVVPEGFRRVEL
jgi:hypothetical protein